MLAMAKPPNGTVVVFWFCTAGPNVNTFWLVARGSGCVETNVKVPLLEAVVAAVAGAGAAAVVVGAVPN